MKPLIQHKNLQYIANNRQLFGRMATTDTFGVIFRKENAHLSNIWDVSWGKQLPSGNEYIVSCGEENSVYLWKWVNDELQLSSEMKSHKFGVISAKMSPDGSKCISVSLDGSAIIWDVQSGKSTQVFQIPSNNIWPAIFSPDGKIIAMGSHSNTLHLVDVTTGKDISQLKLEEKQAMSLAFSSDGKYLAVGTADGLVDVYDYSTLQISYMLTSHMMPVRAIAYSHDSKLFATASNDGQVKLYDSKNAEIIATFSGHQSWVVGLDFHPTKANQLISCSTDHTVKLWDVEERICLQTLSEHKNAVWSVSFNETGTRFISGSDDGTLLVYNSS